MNFVHPLAFMVVVLSSGKEGLALVREVLTLILPRLEPLSARLPGEDVLIALPVRGHDQQIALELLVRVPQPRALQAVAEALASGTLDLTAHDAQITSDEFTFDYDVTISLQPRLQVVRLTLDSGWDD